MIDDPAYTLDFPVLGEWENVDQIRLSMQTCLRGLVEDADRRDTLVMVAGELLENAVKYARRTLTTTTMFRFKVWGALGASPTSVQVANVTDSRGAQNVLDAVASIRGAGSAAEAYFQRMLAIADGPCSMSRLGLLRIAYESGAVLDASVRDETLIVTATIPQAP